MRNKLKFTVIVLFLLLLSDNSKAWDTTAAKFYPLSVGNVYVFDQLSLSFNCISSEFIRKYRVYIDDFILKPNGKYYYKFSGWWAVGGSAPSWEFQRVDSSSMNVYVYNSTSNSEFLIDSLRINSGNTFLCNRFNNESPYASCTGTNSYFIFGEQRIRKSFAARFFGGITSYYSYLEGIGFTGFSICEVGSGTAYSLEGCVIGGVIYGDTTLTAIKQINASIPENFSLSQNFPNPFNPNTIINYTIPSNVKGKTSNVKLTIYNSVGRVVNTLVNEKQNAGSYEVQFNGEGLPSGIYFYKLEEGDFVETKRMILLK